MFNISNFGKHCFDLKEIKRRVPIDVYSNFKKALLNKEKLDEQSSSLIANAMKDWAIELGATHYCHWFQPLSNITAEKHESFLDLYNNEPIINLSSKSLTKGEVDASSFPSGGLRTTHNARGYSYWDYKSPSFIKDTVLYIPSIFVSYLGDALDYKFPLLNSIEYISHQATRILNHLGYKNTTRVTPLLGLEQEFFLIDLDKYLNRSDLRICGRTLIGEVPLKTHEHYLSSIPTRVHNYLKEVNKKLHLLGIYVKTQHSEAAPCQFELAPLYSEMSIAIDQNLIIIETLKTTAYKHNLACLLHEKPFKDINGSGKHNNYSLITNTEINVFEPGNDLNSNIRFLLFTIALISAIDEYAPLIHLTSSNTGNNHRLGSLEAPPSIISVHLGEEVENLFDSLLNDNLQNYHFNNNNHFNNPMLSFYTKDNSDRNRTSPIAFVNNKFEFRMLGSSINASFFNTIINIVLGNTLEEIANKLEQIKDKGKINETILNICKELYIKHKKIIFSGDGYSEEWKNIASCRGLLSIDKFHKSIPYLLEDKYINVLIKHNIFNKDSIKARVNILYEQNNNLIYNEALTIVKMIEQDIIPALYKEINLIKDILSSSYLIEKVEKLSKYIDKLHNLVEKINLDLTEYTRINNLENKASFLDENIYPLLNLVCLLCNKVEKILNKDVFPYPTYEELLSIKEEKEP